MSGILLIIQFVLAVIITIIVLLQKSSSIGLGAYSGSNESLFGAKGPAGFLAKTTFVLGFLFVVNTIALGYFYTKDSQSSILDNVEIPANPTPATPAVPTAPVAPQSDTQPNQQGQ
ncbi:preprotein translocase subunit SecG [Helicobacter canadensis]|uniref:Protein-export membrane protein SecG n=1 Tax=Helicobacter canadensis MIT 98-5491 TaxID=537970 RepID=C5ZVE9_9HELI|nr:preprotein translocase subunit SecG [Helicobacter canadensis]EES88808.1 protein-export membrane protein secG [Helicobacter canadensis MIT 98-5491]EFR48894.1 preprotein translocase, SecG subunit [Helicobacter canadensis MIT 98-5491]STP00074.1 preprotein translocase subunit [Helicobacter canadensis]